jgi:hypothetical protein
MITKEKLIAKRDAAKSVLEQLKNEYAKMREEFVSLEYKINAQAGYVQAHEEAAAEWDKPEEVTEQNNEAAS